MTTTSTAPSLYDLLDVDPDASDGALVDLHLVQMGRRMGDLAG